MTPPMWRPMWRMPLPAYYVFLAGDLVPRWIERVEPPESGFVLDFGVDCEVFRHPGHVEVYPLVPLVPEGPALMRGYRPAGGRYPGVVTIVGGPTRISGYSRHFPNHGLGGTGVALGRADGGRDGGRDEGRGSSWLEDDDDWSAPGDGEGWKG